MLNLGTWKSVGLDRILRFAWANGIRYIDTAKSYGSEPDIGRWLQAMPEARKDLFLVTKDHPQSPRGLIKQLDKRLEDLKTDYVDLIFIHHVGDGKTSKFEVEWPRSKEFKETAEAIRKSGKARFVGFSTHHPNREHHPPERGRRRIRRCHHGPEQPLDRPRTRRCNRALDACHKAGIGLISMKQVAGHADLEKIGKANPRPARERALSPIRRLLHAIWTDERFASCCVSMRNTDQVRENAEAARVFKPLTKAEIDRLRDACIAAGPTLCAGCDGRCSPGGRHHGRARQPDAIPHLSRSSRLSRRGSPALLRAHRRRAKLDRRRPGGRPAGLPQQARLRQALAESRRGPRLIRARRQHQVTVS